MELIFEMKLSKVRYRYHEMLESYFYNDAKESFDLSQEAQLVLRFLRREMSLH